MEKGLELVALAFTSTKNKLALLGADGGQDKTFPTPYHVFFMEGVFCVMLCNVAFWGRDGLTRGLCWVLERVWEV